jgi:hypothetical protein
LLPPIAIYFTHQVQYYPGALLFIAERQQKAQGLAGASQSKAGNVQSHSSRHSLSHYHSLSRCQR